MKVIKTIVEVSFDDLVNGIDMLFMENTDYLVLSKCEEDLHLMDEEYEFGAFSEKVASMLCNGGHLRVTDCYDMDDEDDEEEFERCSHYITKKDIEDAISEISIKYPKIYSDLVTENDDYWTWNSIIQMAAYKDIIYG